MPSTWLPSIRPQGMRGALVVVSLALVAVSLPVSLLDGRVALAAPDATPRTDEERVSFWIERLVRGPEPGRVHVPHYHQRLLEDALRNLEWLAVPALDRLRDPALVRRIQYASDLNPWHNVLSLLARVGPLRPDVARAYARPGVVHPQLIVRRQSIGVLVALADAEDGPTLLAALRADADDRVIAPAAILALVGLGAPWDGEAARAVLDCGTDDGAGVGSHAWAALLSALRPDDVASHEAVLVWTSHVAESSAPRPAPASTRHVAWTPTGPPLAVPLTAAFSSGRAAAAAIRAQLARRGALVFRAAAAADRLSDDPEIAAIAATASSPRSHDAVVDDLRALADQLRRGGSDATPEGVSALVVEARDLPAERAAPPLLALLAALPPDPLWGEAIWRTFDAARAAGASPVTHIANWLRAGRPETVDLALRLVRRTPDDAFLDVVEAWLPDAIGPARTEGRRALAYLYAIGASRNALPSGRLEAFAATLTTWSQDPSDPSAAGLLGTLLELGVAGETAIASGLRGPRRSTYVALLTAHGGRPLGRDVIEALLEGLSPTTLAPLRAEILTAAFRTVGGETAALVLTAWQRLPAAARDEAGPVLRILEHRASRP